MTTPPSETELAKAGGPARSATPSKHAVPKSPQPSKKETSHPATTGVPAPTRPKEEPKPANLKPEIPKACRQRPSRRRSPNPEPTRRLKRSLPLRIPLPRNRNRMKRKPPPRCRAGAGGPGQEACSAFRGRAEAVGTRDRRGLQAGRGQGPGGQGCFGPQTARGRSQERGQPGRAVRAVAPRRRDRARRGRGRPDAGSGRCDCRRRVRDPALFR